MRPVADIDADLKAARLRVEELQFERNEARQAEIYAIAREFDSGKPIRRIARDNGMTLGSVAGLLHRLGRTEKTRTAIRTRAIQASQASA